MAGIGYEIRKLMDEQTFSGDVKAYFFAGIVSSGPWVVSIMCMALLWIFSGPYLEVDKQNLFRVVVVYSYAYSLIITGIIQFILSRFISDKLFLKQRDMLIPTYVAVITFTALSQALVGGLFYSFCEVDFLFKVVGVMLFVAVSCIWQTMIFLTASRDFMAITGAFFIGNVAGLVLAAMMGKETGITGYLLGYTIGQVAIFLLLMYRVFYEFYSTIFCSFAFLRYARKYFDLFLIGLFYYLALWIDKIIYWYSASGEHNISLFYSHYPYDSCMFLAYLTIIPALAHFMIDVETNFYDAYKGFYGTLVNRGSLKEIKAQKKKMVSILKQSASAMLLLQIVITGAFICYAPLLVRFLKLGESDVVIVSTAGVGTFFHVFVLLSLIIILYFDRRRAALIVSACFLATNTLFTLAVIKFAPHLMGAGYALSTFITAVLGITLLTHNVKNIEFFTFVEQPILKPKLPRAQEIAASEKTE